MTKLTKRVVATLLTLSLLAGILPIAPAAAYAAGPEAYSIDNGNIRVDVSTVNGGFAISTGTGDKLNKADDNKNLLYHRGEYDTSFTSFEVTYPGTPPTVREYVFGGNYGFLGLASTDVTVTKTGENEILAVWSVAGLTFTEAISLANPGSSEHGMVSIGYAVANSTGAEVSVKARLLLDTALGNKDYAYYQVIDDQNHYRSITTETVLGVNDHIPQNFFGYEDPYNPTITSYTVNVQTCMPYQVAFGHWNNLAATAFDFTPVVPLMDFTYAYNDRYFTADSAYALYYDLGPLPNLENRTFMTYYGVYSHRDVAAGDKMTVDIASPASLSLNAGKTAYVRKSSTGTADFEVQIQAKNVPGKEQSRSSVTLAIYTAKGLTPLDREGGQVPGLNYVDYDDIDPYILVKSDVAANDTITENLYFKAQIGVNAEYRKIKLEVYDTSTSAALTESNLLGSNIFYILCPGTDGDLPRYTFSSMAPSIIYYSGNRHLYLTGTNVDILYTAIQEGKCALRAYTKDTSDNIQVTAQKENIFQPEPGTLDVVLTGEMVLGDWYMQLEWSDAAVAEHLVPASEKISTAPALAFTVSDKPEYKNDTYGVIAVVQTKALGAGTQPTYRIMSFTGESKFKEFEKGALQPDKVTYIKDYVEILLVFRGEFTIDEVVREGGKDIPSLVTATSLKSFDAGGEAHATNVISINNCIDFENGVLKVSYASTSGNLGNIRVEFDGDLYTSNARTSIWKGEAAFTEIKQNEEFSLIPYTQDGVRGAVNGKKINLVWPSIYGIGQTIAGMVFNFAFGELGVMKDSTTGVELGRVISFSAKLDLGMLIPDKRNGETENTYWTRLKEFWKFYTVGEGGMYSYWTVHDPEETFSKEVTGKDEGSASVMVQDILYGCGAGFIGVRFNVNVSLPSYVEKMPKIEGTLDVNTIGNWSFGVEGKMKMATFMLEAALTIKSHNDIPVPDKIYFFVGGFEPGVNIDGFGVLWITGGGGGIDHLYDTIFLKTKLPPLKLMLAVTFDVLKVLTARADLSLSLSGISFSATDIGIKGVNLIILEKMAATINWYPDLYLMASLKMNLFQLIFGSGYMVLQGQNYSDWLFEAFVRAVVKVPPSIPVVGGLELAGVDLGVSSEKIWGALKVLLITLGITYYWGGELDFGSGTYANPTFPELLGYDDMPVHFDEATGRTLYMRVGTNLSLLSRAEIAENLDSVVRLMGVPSLYSNADRLHHKFNLGTRMGTNDAIVQIVYSASGIVDARAAADAIITGSIHSDVVGDYAITLYDLSKSQAENEAAGANANVTYDSAAGKGTLAFTVTDNACYDIDWTFSTPVAADVTLFNVAPVPEITAVTGTISSGAAGDSIDLDYTGSGLDALDSVAFFLVSDPTNMYDAGYSLVKLTRGAANQIVTTATDDVYMPVPASIPSGVYYIRAVYVKDGEVNGTITSAAPVRIENSHTPAAPSISFVRPGGDLTIDIGLAAVDAEGYVVNIYKYVQDPDTLAWGWEYTDINNLAVDSADIVDKTISVGGSYEVEEQGAVTTKGLAANTPYRIGLIPFNLVDENGDGTDDTAVYGVEVYYSDSITLPPPTPPVITLIADRQSHRIVRDALDSGGATTTVTYDTFVSPDISFTATSGEAITGTWVLDEGNTIAGSFSGLTSVAISLTGLSEGDHTLVIKGVDNEGDGFRDTYAFSVDTLPPRLLLSSPAEGSFFNKDGTLTVAGITDSNALFTVVSDGHEVYCNRSISELGSIDSEGAFSFDVALPDAHASTSHHVLITASDQVGNSTYAEATVHHGGLGDIAEVNIYANGVQRSDGNIGVNQAASSTSQLSLIATTSTGVDFVLTDSDLVSWQCFAALGTASVTDSGLLTMGAGSIGFITGALRVAMHGSMTASSTFGAERYAGRQVMTASTLGGSVTGAGAYGPGDTVTLAAIPDPGYYFKGWTLTGATIPNPSSATITFIMPDNNVTATATFAVHSDSLGRPEGSGSLQLGPVWAGAGTKAIVKLPDGTDEDSLVPYYYAGGVKTYVTISAAKDGYVTFIAPVAGTYYFEHVVISFSDDDGHWAEDNNAFVAARALFGGIGDGLFDPEGTMTRAMFVTVLWRLAGKPQAGNPVFSDVEPDEWYTEAIAWAAETGIVNGYDTGLFGTGDNLTREQMCAILQRYIQHCKYNLAALSQAKTFADGSSISDYAVEAVRLLQTLGVIDGKEDNLFDPWGLATRAECATIFCRLIKALL